MKLPAIFKQDIQSKNIQLIPLLIIERESGTAHLDENSIFLSTHDITVQRSDDNSTGLPYLDQGQGLWDNGMYFSPLLIDNPVISEKIDIEKRKYTISKCTFKISNNTYNGQRFSDMLNTDSLIGKKVNFAYKSINSSFPVGSMFLDSQGLSSWEDLYDSNEYISPTFYFGEIRDIKHNNEVVTITAEDLGASFLHQELPKNSLPTNSSVPAVYRGAKIPMVYGYVPKSPVVMGANNKIYADSRPIQGWFKNDIDNSDRYNYPFDNQDFGALFVNIDDHYCCVADTIKYKLADNTVASPTTSYFDFSGYEDEPKQVEYVDDDTYDSTTIARLVENPLLSRKVFQLMVAYKPPSITLLKRNRYMSWNTDLYNDYPNSLGDAGANWDTEENYLLEEEVEYMTDSDYNSTIELAESSPNIVNNVQAMINYVSNTQFEDNFYKHSIFRFSIDTEPPIDFINRGGISNNGNWGTYWHWISFGHWTMPEQSINVRDSDHNIYTYAKRGYGTLDQSFNTIRKKQYGEDEVITYNHYMPDEDLSAQTTFGKPICLADIVRFSDFHDHADFAPMNPEQVNWQNFELNGKSPLAFYDISTDDEDTTGDHDHVYTNPFVKFTNAAHLGKYIVDLGAYGWRSAVAQTSGNTEGWRDPSDIDDVSENFEYEARLRGWLPEVNCLSVCDTKVTFKDMYGSISGRTDGGVLIKHPADIIADIFVNEMGYSPNKIDQESLAATKEGVNAHGNYEFCFTQKDAINSKDLIEDIAKSTFIFPRIGFDGTLKFPQIKRRYEQVDLDKAIVIEYLDVINYSYNLTKRQELRTATDIKYNYDYHSDNYFGDSKTKGLNGSSVVNPTVVEEEHLEFNGLENIDDNREELKSKYMRTELNYDPGLTSNFQINTIKDHQAFATHHYRNRHLVIKCKLPLRYLDIDVGEYIRFNKLIDGVKAYGIDYSKTELLNNQYLYPLFICTNIKKTIEYVEVECMQLHHLRYADALHGSPYENWLNIADDTVPSVYYEPGQTVEEQEEEDLIDDEIIDDETEEEFALNLFDQAQYIYTTFNLIEGEVTYPYGMYLESQYLEIMSIQDGYNFGDEGTGIHSLFSPEHFKVKYSDSDEFIVAQSWNDLLPADFITTDNSNIGYTVLEVVHFNYGFGYNYTYKLKNMQTIIGDPIQIGWELIVNQENQLAQSGKIIAAPFVDQLFSGSQFILKNKSPYIIKYDSPHPVEIEEISEGIDTGGGIDGGSSVDNVVGDINNDGIVDVTDLVQLVNIIMEVTTPTEVEQDLADLNEDGIIDVLDIVEMVNTIMGNN